MQLREGLVVLQLCVGESPVTCRTAVTRNHTYANWLQGDLAGNKKCGVVNVLFIYLLSQKEWDPVRVQTARYQVASAGGAGSSELCVGGARSTEGLWCSFWFSSN